MAKLRKWFIHNNQAIIFFLCMIIFIALAEDVFKKDIMQGDILAYNFISKYLINNSLTPIIKVITNLGSASFLIGVTVLIWLVFKDKKIALFSSLNLVIIAALNQMFKFILQRPRPTELRLINETGYSFPSGHSMISTAFYGYFIYLIYKKVKNKYLKWTLMILLSMIILMIGLSRIYLGVHYASDVLAGILFSISYLMLFIKITNRKIETSSKMKLKKIMNSFKYAWSGIKSAFNTEKNMKIHVYIMLLVIAFGFIFQINQVEWLVCIICFALVISGELLNTAIEIVVDIAMPNKDDRAKRAKDISAGAVLVLAFSSFVIGLIIFIPKLFKWTLLFLHFLH